ncbi:hypothetical protein B0T17DRAFT_590339 [Bombardia bombarda]|uniref:Uncharacterized protein n=1 Tax=Bombardia bombarda TaxID=252184 RepID=A0AA39XD56_9PEZI|nr:hypothetical protein B0T17DRAFT_590339 [Bombardia bombarda]
MVKLTTIYQSNTASAAQQPPAGGLVCVFLGATSGIGASTAEKLASLLGPATFYIAGRSQSRFASQKAKLERLNRDLKVVFFEGEMSLLADVDAFSKIITGAEKKVDYLCMSAGMLPLGGARYTKENLELCLALSYYARTRLTANLLPLLHHASPAPRVLGPDVGLERNWTPHDAMNQSVTLTSLALDHLSESAGGKIVFIHSFPGLVKTDIFNRVTAVEGTGIFARLRLAVMRLFVRVLMVVKGMSPEECAERQVYYLTSDVYTARLGQGVVRVDDKSEVFAEEGPGGVLGRYREEGWPARVWEFTIGVFERVTGGV